MKTSRVIVALAGLAILAALGAAYVRRNVAPPNDAAPAVAHPLERIFTVRGMILSVDPQAGIVRIAHEEIPDYMPAMTMPFMVRDSNILRNVKPGDQVSFNLSVTSDDSWISSMEKRSGTASESGLASRAQGSDGDATRLQPGESIPDLTFVDQDGNARKFTEFSDKFLVLTFIYTRCPLPNFCPLLTRKFGELQDRLGKEFPGKFHLLSVTIDPAYDTPELLKHYASVHSSDPARWTFATGTKQQVAAIAELFGLTYDQKIPGLIDHDMRTALIAPKGQLLHIWKSNFWTPYEIRNRMEEHLHRSDVAQQ
jgi:protein SCO1/2